MRRLFALLVAFLLLLGGTAVAEDAAEFTLNDGLQVASAFDQINHVNTIGQWTSASQSNFTGPTAIGNIAMWYSVLSPTSVTKDASNTISQWNDLSSSAYNVTSSGALKPSWVASCRISLPCISFPIGTRLNNATNTSMAAESFFAVMEYDGTSATVSGTSAPLLGRGTSPNISTTADTLNWTGAGSTDGTTGLRNGHNLISQSWVIFAGVRTSATDLYPGGGTGNTGKICLYENYAYLKCTTHTAGNVTTALFMARDASNNMVQMKLQEYIVFSRAVTDAERINMVKWLNNQYHIFNDFAGLVNFNAGLQRYFTAHPLATSATASIPVVVLSGQSNAGGEAQISLTALNPLVQGPISSALIYSPTTAGDFFTLQVGVNNQPNSAPSTSTIKHGMELAMMYDLVQFQSTTALIKCVQGGTSLATRWSPGIISTNNLLRTCWDKVELARYNAGYRFGWNMWIQLHDWYQGEQDATDGGTSVTNYGVNEQNMIAATRAFEKTFTPWAVVKVRDVTEPSANYDAVTAAKVNNGNIIVPGELVVEGWTGQSPVGGPHGNSVSMFNIGNSVAALLGASTTIH